MRRVLALCACVAGAGLIAAFTGTVLVAQDRVTTVRQMALPTSTVAAPTGTGLILGQLVDAEGNRPIAGATVTLGGGVAGPALASGLGAPASAPAVMTNAEGYFVFRDLPKASYTLSAQAPGYLPSSYGQKRPDGGPSRSIELADGQRVVDAVIRAWKVGVITGRVTDDAGEPIVGIGVRALRREASGRFAVGTPQNTDDRGIYRISALVPGEYIVTVSSTMSAVPSALVQSLPSGPVGVLNTPLARDVPGLALGLTSVITNMSFDGLQIVNGPGGILNTLMPNLAGARVRAYPTTFHPGALAPHEAATVRVASGQERDGVDIAMRMMPMYTVSGRVMGLAGPMGQMGIRLVPSFSGAFSADSNFDTAVTATGPDGTFRFIGVPAGQYEVRALRVPNTVAQAQSTMTIINTGGGSMLGLGAAAPSLPRHSDEPTLWAVAPVVVGTNDVANVLVTLQSGTRLHGRVQFDGPSPPTAADRLRLSINLISSSDRQLQLPQPAPVEDDLSFTGGEYPPGRYLVNVASVPAGWTAVEARVGGVNALVDAVSIDGGSMDDLVVTLSNRQARLSGTVKGATAGDPDAVVVVFPFDHRAWIETGMASRLVRTTAVQPNGTFDIANLLPGTYAVVAVPSAAALDTRNGQQIELLARAAVRVSIAVGEQKSASLTVTPLR